jgi:hypothetical protein
MGRWHHRAKLQRRPAAWPGFVRRPQRLFGGPCYVAHTRRAALFKRGKDAFQGGNVAFVSGDQRWRNVSPIPAGEALCCPKLARLKRGKIRPAALDFVRDELSERLSAGAWAKSHIADVLCPPTPRSHLGSNQLKD